MRQTRGGIAPRSAPWWLVAATCAALAGCFSSPSVKGGVDGGHDAPFVDGAANATSGHLPVLDERADASANRGAEAETARTALEEASLEHHVYRHVHVGLIDYPSRFTWILLRGARSVQLKRIAQRAAKRSELLRIDGRINDEATWEPPSITEWAGEQQGSGLDYRLEAVRCTKTDPPPCGGVQTPMILHCRSASVPVLQSGATLRAGGSSKVAKWEWAPNAREQVPVLRCAIERESRSFDSDLMFAEPKNRFPGIEWVFDNSDAVVQEGAYRWMPAPP